MSISQNNIVIYYYFDIFKNNTSFIFLSVSYIFMFNFKNLIVFIVVRFSLLGYSDYSVLDVFCIFVLNHYKTINKNNQ